METAVDVVEHIAEVTEKLAANVADQLPEDGSLQKAAEEVEYLADILDKDAEEVETIAKKVCSHILVFFSSYIFLYLYFTYGEHYLGILSKVNITSCCAV